MATNLISITLFVMLFGVLFLESQCYSLRKREMQAPPPPQDAPNRIGDMLADLLIDGNEYEAINKKKEAGSAPLRISRIGRKRNTSTRTALKREYELLAQILRDYYDQK